jgi:hypothetical protein
VQRDRRLGRERSQGPALAARSVKEVICDHLDNINFVQIRQNPGRKSGPPSKANAIS